MFNERISKLRELKGWSQLEVSKRLGIARTTYSGYENGSREPNLEILEKMSKLFDVTIDYLITGRDGKLNEGEEKILKDFLKLSDVDQKMILEFMERLKKSSS